MFDVGLIQTIDVYFFSFFVLILIGVKTLSNAGGKTPQARAFTILLGLIFLIIIADCVTILFDGHSGPTVRVMMTTASVFGFCLQVLICLFWFWYVRSVVFVERRILGLTAIIESIPALVCVIVAVASIWTGWFFSVDAENTYHRGPLFALIAIVSFLYLCFGYFMIIRYRRNLDRRHLIALLSFALPPSVGGLIQALCYGVILLWPSMTISLLIVYMAIQNDLLLLDYQTGLNNRRGFDQELRRRIMNASIALPGMGGKAQAWPFALMLLDIKNFRSINDRYGHVECDEALVSFAKILGFFFRHNGYACRYGGDEFAVIIELRDLRDLESVRDRLQTKLDEWNAASGKPWSLAVSIGCAPYTPASRLTADQFMTQVDRLLSLDKIVPGDRRSSSRRKI